MFSFWLVLLFISWWETESFSPTHNHERSRFKRSIGLADTIAAKSKSNSSSSHWNVWKTADKLEQFGVSSTCHPASDELVQNIISILREWGDEWAGEKEWQGILNKSSLLHEVEESIVALHYLGDYISKFEEKEITLVDVCCGKGILSLLCSYVFKYESKVHKIIMLDNANIKWAHIKEANNRAKIDGRPKIESWAKCNLHESDEVVSRLESVETPLALVGIHLCKTLSPTAVGIVNSIDPLVCPFFLLAPCCLPRVVVQSKIKKKGSIIEVRQYETHAEREARRIAKERRSAAMTRSRPATMRDQIDISVENSACWRCGEIGHRKADCPSLQVSGKPQLLKTPSVKIDVSGVLDSEKPFEFYCSLLATTIQRDEVTLVNSGLVNEKAEHQKNNWNNERKSLFIVAIS